MAMTTWINVSQDLSDITSKALLTLNLQSQFLECLRGGGVFGRENNPNQDPTLAYAEVSFPL